MSHRLNLVVRGFESVEYIKDVLKCIDSLSTRRKAVEYKKWLCQAHKNNRNRKIPKPSETRWCFYQDVLDALLSPETEFEEFLWQDKELVLFTRSLNFLEERRESAQPSFPNNPFVDSHFRFALFILEKITVVITQLQQRFMTMPLA